jgi:hypothetical protein
MLCCAVLCCAVLFLFLCCAVLCCAVLCCAVLCCLSRAIEPEKAAHSGMPAALIAERLCCSCQRWCDVLPCGAALDRAADNLTSFSTTSTIDSLRAAASCTWSSPSDWKARHGPTASHQRRCVLHRVRRTLHLGCCVLYAPSTRAARTIHARACALPAAMYRRSRRNAASSSRAARAVLQRVAGCTLHVRLHCCTPCCGRTKGLSGAEQREAAGFKRGWVSAPALPTKLAVSAGSGLTSPARRWTRYYSGFANVPPRSTSEPRHTQWYLLAASVGAHARRGIQHCAAA